MTETVHFTHGDHEWEVEIRYGDKLCCPVGKCRRSFDSEKGLTAHISEAHGILKRETRFCDACDEEYRATPENPAQRFCSEYCAREVHRVE